MSEYQYYEFQAVDRPLTPEQVTELRNCSSRALITPVSFVNEYNWGDFKGSPDKWMEKYFDAFFYVANWGTRRLMLRVPEKSLPMEAAMTYSADESFTCHTADGYLILSFYIEEAEYDWFEEVGWLASLVPLRADLLRGDYRCLYLGWLLAVQEGEFDEEALEPAVPPGLADLSGPAYSLAECFGIDPDLIDAAAERSASELSCGLPKEVIASWVADLPGEEKDALLMKILEDDDLFSAAALRQRARCEIGDTKQVGFQDQDHDHRTVGQLLARAEWIYAKRRKEEAERRAREKAGRERDRAERRGRYLASLYDREDILWVQVDELIATRQPKGYDEAVALLQDLHDVANMRDRNPEFSRRMSVLYSRHKKKPSLLRRLQNADLLD
jgi:hypothetical protein